MHYKKEYIKIDLPGYDQPIEFFEQDFTLWMYTGTNIVLYIGDKANSSTVYHSSPLNRLQANKFLIKLSEQWEIKTNGLSFNGELILVFVPEKIHYYNINHDGENTIIEFSADWRVDYYFFGITEVESSQFDIIFKNFGLKKKE